MLTTSTPGVGNVPSNGPLAGDEAAFERALAPHRRELKAYCYRMSGSLHDAEDLLQDAMLRAWKGRDAFEGRSSVRTWLFKIATNTCLNALEAKKARALPMDLGPPGSADDAMQPLPELAWLEPCPNSLYAGPGQNPEEHLGGRESVALAFIAALQLLPPKQRALLILHEVLGLSAAEAGDLLGLSIAAVSSALQRARATLDAHAQRRPKASPTLPGEVKSLLERYLRAWEAADVGRLVALLHEDATLSMPPIPVWLRGAATVCASLAQMVFATAAPGDFKGLPTEASGFPAVAVYRRDGASFRPYALHVLEPSAGRLTAVTAFLDTRVFAAFELPPTI